MKTGSPTPERVMQIATGGWACAVLGAAVHHSIFDHLEAGATAPQVAQKTGLSPRGVQALLDGVSGLGFATVKDGVYRNTPDASTFLVRGRPSFIGGMPEVMAADLPRWADIFEVAKTGAPKENIETAEENPFWEKLVPAIAGLSVPVARLAAEEIGMAKAGPVRWLDVGGGSGVYSAIWLELNPQARGVQLDWANVNGVARTFVGRFGVADRFETIDGDFRTTDFEKSLYDFGLYSHIAHQESPKSNVEIFRKFRKALKPGGTLVINDFILEDDRTGHPFALLFTANMMMFTKEGSSWRKGDYRAWLSEAGFPEIRFKETGTPSTLVFAR